MSLREARVLRSLRSYNFRVWSVGALVSNLGTWMQRAAQDWLVLTELTHRDARALGIVVALQFAPQVLLLPWTGWVADHVDRRRVLFATQSVMGALALGLGLLTISGAVRTWHVEVFAVMLGCASAFDAPSRHTFVAEMVGEEDLSNAVALNATSFHGSGVVGPALAGLLIAAVGSGWAFMLNGASFAAVLLSLALVRPRDLHRGERPPRTRGSFAAGLRYVAARRNLQVLLAMMLVMGALGLNGPVFVSTMAASVFHVGAEAFGLLLSAMATGAVVGALIAARLERPRLGQILVAAVVFGLGYAAAAITPGCALFALTLVVVGAASQTVTTSTVGLVQLSTEPVMRGRVTALLLTVLLGGQPLGAPLVGWIAAAWGPRLALAVGAMAGGITAAIGAVHLVRGGRSGKVDDPLTMG